MNYFGKAKDAALFVPREFKKVYRGIYRQRIPGDFTNLGTSFGSLVGLVGGLAVITNEAVPRGGYAALAFGAVFFGTPVAGYKLGRYLDRRYDTYGHE